ncbi:Inosine triphosphate pyrophosphatase [Geodia barretti]|uniref:Inosine triphosphate pyrophosphatase n=1 Tax=Geodia barretti TaxID=519541 RepID=A0AA35T756_GEOBA|nr:Inosine triphosphate pyrophosphatase [Geodia barretti]
MSEGNDREGPFLSREAARAYRDTVAAAKVANTPTSSLDILLGGVHTPSAPARKNKRSLVEYGSEQGGRERRDVRHRQPQEVEEVRAILGESLGWTLTSRDVDLPELQGEPEDIARDKCLLASERVEGAVMTEDTVSVTMLGGCWTDM